MRGRGCGARRALREAVHAASGPTGRFERADAVIVAVGRFSRQRGLLPKGVPFREPEPTLGPLATEPRWAAAPRQHPRARGAGTVAPGEETPPEERGRHGLPMDTHEGERLASREVGEVMFRKYGVSASPPST